MPSDPAPIAGMPMAYKSPNQDHLPPALKSVPKPKSTFCSHWVTAVVQDDLYVLEDAEWGNQHSDEHILSSADV